MVSVNIDMELGIEGTLATPWLVRMVYLPPTISRLWISWVTIYWKAGVPGRAAFQLTQFAGRIWWLVVRMERTRACSRLTTLPCFASAKHECLRRNCL
jgi:hypothetical protein